MCVSHGGQFHIFRSIIFVGQFILASHVLCGLNIDLHIFFNTVGS